jgi:proteasome accessory factor B
VSEKNERLINLAIALISAKRPISKEQIFRSIEGYSGNQEAKDRMFERDKEALKSLGIDITIAPIDRLFDDEVGYQITEKDYAVSFGDLSAKEIGFLTVAAKIWEETSLAESANEIIRRLHSLGVAAEIELGPIYQKPTDLTEILEAIHLDNCVSFSYTNEENATETRRLAPFAISSNQGLWYVHGKDLGLNSLRTFRLDRFASLVEKIDLRINKPKDFQVPSFIEGKVSAKIKIRRDLANTLRSKAIEIIHGDDWDIATIDFPSKDSALFEILWHGDNVEIIEPLELRNTIIQRLDEVVKDHV